VSHPGSLTTQSESVVSATSSLGSSSKLIPSNMLSQRPDIWKSCLLNVPSGLLDAYLAKAERGKRGSVTVLAPWMKPTIQSPAVMLE
jgi:DNA-binding IscR family transcriptional regulator